VGGRVPYHFAMMLSADICQRAMRARDARFDGIFFVGITTTRIYCRPVCPSRLATPIRRRFFDSAAAAEQAGFRPCLRCRPELAPGRALCDAVPRLARVAAHRIAAGALNGQSVGQLAHELGVSERHVRRALEREVGVSPLALAQTHRLLLAKRLLADTDLPVTRIAFASGFQSLRRFNSVFREHYRLAPSALRPRQRPAAADHDLVRLTLTYRAPLAWDALLSLFAADALPGVEVAGDGRYARTVRLDGRSGVLCATDAAPKAHLNLDVSPSLLPALMPLLSTLHHCFDLDAEPSVIDAHLAEGGLGTLVRRRPGVRIPGTLDGFEAALRVLLRGPGRPAVVRALGEGLDTGVPGLERLAPEAGRVAAAGPGRLAALGVPVRRAAALAGVARAIADGKLRLEPGTAVAAARRGLLAIEGISDRLATAIVLRALDWPDAFPAADAALQRAAGAASARELYLRAERWRPWRAYAALHLWLSRSAPDRGSSSLMGSRGRS
jgi:AraC family transcriptional regulator, regulatory protein of adaptative response / DNA-3-methyladenine glycosylase II